MTGQVGNDSHYKVTKGINGLAKVILTSANHASAEIYLHGAHVTSWVPAGGTERLFLSRSSEFDAKASIRGGTPVIFPQFGKEGSLPRHGFARRMEWAFVKAEEGPAGVTATFQLRDDQASRRIWPHSFLAHLAVSVGGQHLELSLTITNMDHVPFSFTGALHTYLRVADIAETHIEGLGGLPYLDTVGGRIERVQQEERLSFKGEVDSIYFNAPARLVVQDKHCQIGIEAHGFPDVVVWNPWSELAATLADMEPGGYRHMLCVEAAVVGKLVTLKPSESWSGVQRLTA
jgi:glucose-6-phosphate 1-epimerase